jgi:hypothetical protein
VPAWRLLAVTAPTNLPPVSSEVQSVAVDATGGTFTLSFTNGTTQTTAPIASNASATEVASALDALGNIGGASGSVEVSGGPGDAGATSPYFIRFAGSLGGVNVAQMTADPSQLSGGGVSVTVTTKTGGGTAGAGQIVVNPANVGGAATSSGTATLVIGPLPTGIVTSATNPSGGGWTCTNGAGQVTVTCTRTTSVPVENLPPAVTVSVAISSSAAINSKFPVLIEGGGATEKAKYEVPVTVSSIPAGPGIQALWAGAFDENGNPEIIAGGHPTHAGAFFRLNTIVNPSGGIVPAGDARDIGTELPPGFVGNPLVTVRCPQYQLYGGSGATACPAVAAVGHVKPQVGGTPAATTASNEPLYNDEPAFGYPAQFTFVYVIAQSTLGASLRSDGDYGVTVTAPNVPLYDKLYGAFAMLNGNPPGAPGKSFLANSTNCAEQALAKPITTIAANTWQVPSLFEHRSVEIEPVVGCEALTEAWVGKGPHPAEEKPSFQFQPGASEAATGTAVTAHLHIPQEGLTDPNKLATADLKKSVVTLPEGLDLNPAAADGLHACSEAQIGFKGTGFPMPNPIRFDKSDPTCPDASKIGTMEVETPLLEEPLDGTVYLAAQEENPFHSLIAMYLVIDDPKTGTVVKLPGEVRNDASTGQITAVFDDNPQLPIEDLILQFRGGGPRSTLATPDVCAKYTTHGEWTPWSVADLEHPASSEVAQTEDSFNVSSGLGGSSSCPTSKAARPFSLGLSAGTTNTNAGQHSPFTLRLTRPDGNQELDKIAVTTPPGFAATFKGVATCSNAQVAAAEAAGRTGKQELANPSCPASSQIGTTAVAAGVGSQPLQVKTGKIYLTGPYKGAPLSFTFIVPAVAGPFDLGVQVVRTAVTLNPKNAQATATSDPIPQILKGIPLLIREVQVNLDRSDFTLNPTNCEPMAVTARVTGSSGAVANLSNRFQVGNCGALGFKPGLKIQLHGGTRRGDYQRLSATVTYPKKGLYANVARAAVTLPHSSFLAQEHIRTVCTRVQFAAHECPKASIYGHAKAITPLLDQPLTGPVYLRSSDNLLPDLVAALKGPESMPIEVELDGRTDSKNGGIRNTFDMVPDAPVSKFTLELQGGKKSLIVNSRNLCNGVQKATARFTAQNGKTSNFRPTVGNDCGKSKHQKSHKQHKRHASNRLAWRLRGW